MRRVLLFSLLAVAGLARAAEAPLTVFAAASLTNVLEEIGRGFTAATGMPVRFSFAASSVLARQIESGAPADVFASADQEWMDYLQQRGLIASATRKDVVSNTLVLVAPASSTLVLKIAPGFALAGALGERGRLAIADPETVPAGRYAKSALGALGVWDSVSGRLVPSDNVRTALTFVVRGETPLGIVYGTDARAEPRVRVVDVFPESSHAPIRYPVATTSKASPVARAFVDYLSSAQARGVFEKAGFGSIAAAQEFLGRMPFEDQRNPPAWVKLPERVRAHFEQGQAIFKSKWAPAGQAGAETRDGLGPLFIASSCDGCHNDGGRGRTAPRPGVLSSSFVMQLGGKLTDYGHVLSPQALEGFTPEARIRVEHVARTGRYADGQTWSQQEPRYFIEALGYGPLPTGTVLRPRIAPSLFGVGLLDAVPVAALQRISEQQPAALRGELAQPFGWQGDVPTVVDQTARALAREMGITYELQPQDDCTAAQVACRSAPQGGSPEASGEVFAALLAFEVYLAVPARPAIDTAIDASGQQLFARTGCADCHQSSLPVEGEGRKGRIDAYTDLLVHDMGTGLADRDLGGHPVKSMWRTAPLWGLSHFVTGGEVALLHDGRARNIEEAILWHDGQARAARQAFATLPGGQRRQLLDWIATL